ncbi:ACDE family multidrug resistance protein [Nocardioides zeae]|uniref:ACDE family multidrug resistance protein n=1 Tax=Nocardioides zeae TaxID=1457234 RepID=A0ACC6IML6_9ACTN|nr:MFS transporter [Nocardioides zeae]MDR6173356.1 ACDE family multidrug resistance protein [Nocardioides zeae]MDR6211996.1 ACDE family multidrug resistance protein [Nocardioides zeae]
MTDLAARTTPTAAPASPPASPWRQPRAVWAVAFACVIAFMGIGLVDPILKEIAAQLEATPSQVSLLFTSYMAVMGVAMLVTGVVSSRIGAKRTLLTGLVLIIVFAALAGASGSVGAVIGFRAGWGLGNALFIATALSTIVSASTGSLASAIILFEAALGLGIASGPLLGGLLGGISWRGPFFGVSVLMAIAVAATAVFLPATPPTGRRTSLADPFRALRHPALLLLALVAVFYNLGFFTLMAAGPFALPSFDIMQVGWTFFGWGVLLAITSVVVAPRLQRRFGTLPSMIACLALFALDLAVMALLAETEAVVALGIVLAGAFLGVNNTLVTEAVMGAAPVERPVASAAYSFVRFTGGAVGPFVALKLAEHVDVHAPFWFGAAAVAVGVVVALAGARTVNRALHGAPASHSEGEAAAIAVGDAD